MDGIAGIKNELQVSFFGFSALSFHDSMYNNYVQAWEEVCKKYFTNELKSLSEKDKMDFITFPFRVDKITEMFRLMKVFCVSDIFKIPESVTLPEFKTMQTNIGLVMTGQLEEVSKQTSDKMFEEKLEKIRKLREKIAKTDQAIEEYRGCSKVLETLGKAKDELAELKVSQETI